MRRSALGRASAAAGAILLASALAGCGKAGDGAGLGARSSGQTLAAPAGQPAAGAATLPSTADPGTVGVVTEDTTRVGAGDPIADAAAVARTIFPGMTAQTRPQAVVLVDDRDWRTALAATVLMSSPLRAPLLFTDQRAVPPATAAALRATDPTGALGLSDAQVIRVGSAAAVARGYATLGISGSDPASLAVALERLSAQLRGTPPHHVLIVDADAPAAWAMPAAGLSAESGAPILFVNRAGIPAVTEHALKALSGLSMYLIGPTSVIGDGVAASLARYGQIHRIAGADPISNAIAVAQFELDGFGWGVVDPGHGLVFVNSSQPLDAAAAAALSDGGDYGPLLLLDANGAIPPELASYLASIQPGYTSNPRFAAVRGVYNRGWLIGGAESISMRTQAQLDGLLEIVPSGTPPPTGTPPATGGVLP